MQQHLVVWGDIGTDHKALIAINLDSETNQVIYRAFPEEDVTKQLQDQLFTIWKNGGDFEFPEDVPTWTVDANEDNILPSEIRLHKPGMLVTAQRHWNKKVVLDATFKLLGDKLHVLELEMDSLQQYDQGLWDKTRGLWDEILELRKKDELSWQNADELKLRINLIFDALKAFRRLNQEKNYDESIALFKLFSKRADDCLERLIYPDEWKKIVNDLIALQKEMKEAPLVMKHRRGVERKINIVFNDLRKYRKSDQINHLKDRIQGLNRVLRALKGAIERDSESYKNQFEKLKHYTRGKMSDDEIREQLGTVKSRTGDKEKKIKSITKTIRSLESKIENLKKPEPPKKKKKKAPKQNAETGAAPTASAKDPAEKTTPVKAASKSGTKQPAKEAVVEDQPVKAASNVAEAPAKEAIPEEVVIEPIAAKEAVDTETPVKEIVAEKPVKEVVEDSPVEAKSEKTDSETVNEKTVQEQEVAETPEAPEEVIKAPEVEGTAEATETEPEEQEAVEAEAPVKESPEVKATAESKPETSTDEVSGEEEIVEDEASAEASNSTESEKSEA